jgi:hypothetical protein
MAVVAGRSTKSLGFMAHSQTARSKILFDVFESTIEARAHWQCWWAMGNQAKLTLRPQLNRYSDFFNITERAHFNSLFINLGNLFDKRRDASSLDHYFRLARDRFSTHEIAEFRARLAGHEQAREGALVIRNGVIAHKTAGQTERQVFIAAGIRPRNIRDLVIECSEIVNRLVERENWTNRVFVSDQFFDATLGVISSIKP